MLCVATFDCQNKKKMECSSSRQPQWVTTKFNKLKIGIEQTARSVKKLAKDDPRRIVHGLKVALGITLVSLLYSFEPLFEGYGVAAMWAVLTVVVVFEFSVGAMLGKGINRVFATVFGGMLGVGAHILGSFAGDDVEPFILAIFVFLLAAFVTFMRFMPELKARYDYGLMIVILTFSLVVVSGYQDDEVFDQSNRRISAILVGCSAAVAICILICPVWAGGDLHNLTANNIDKLANFLQVFGDEYFKEEGQGTFSEEKKELMEGFKSVLNSKNSEDSLVNYAKWEPRHGRFKYRHPWAQYQKIGDLNRQLASTIESLNRYLHAQNQVPKEVKAKIEKACKKMSMESGKALEQISTAMKSMAHPPSTAQAHLRNSQWACKTLNTIWAHHGPIAQFVPAATVASLLGDAVSFSVSIAESVRELAVLPPFKDTVDDDVDGDQPVLEKAESLPTDQAVVVGMETLVRFSTYKDPPSLDMVHQNGE